MSIDNMDYLRSKRETIEPRKEKPLVDLSYKLFLIKDAIKNTGDRYNFEEISEFILLKKGIYISSEECLKITKKYSFLIRKSNHITMFFSLVTVSLIFYLITDRSLLFFIVALALFPLVFNFFTEVKIFSNLLFFNPKELTPALTTDLDSLKTVSIVIASRNEPFEVAKMTFDSAFSLVYPDYKKEIVVVDNSDTSFSDYLLWKNYVESFGTGGQRRVEGIHVAFIHRDGVDGFKPRNLDIALDHVAGEFILYLDIDSTVHQDALLRTIHLFERDCSLGFMQLFTTPTNAKGKSSLALVQSLRNYFLRLETAYCAHTMQNLFYGHNAIWRTEVVRAMGSCLEYHRGMVVVTEDLSMSFRASFNGYYGIGVWLESGEWVPESMRETEAMWLRWTFGTYQVYAKYFTKLENLKQFKTHEIIGWLQHFGTLLNYGLLPFYIGLGLFFNSNLLMLMVFLSLLPEVVQSVSAYFNLSLNNMPRIKKIGACYSAFLALGSFVNWVRCKGLIRFIVRKKQGWRPTGKSTEGEISLYRVLSENIGFLIFGASCLFYSAYLLVYVSHGLINNFLIFICAIYGLNHLIAVFLFGKSSMQEDTATAVIQGDIKNFSGFYIK